MTRKSPVHTKHLPPDYGSERKWAALVRVMRGTLRAQIDVRALANEANLSRARVETWLRYIAETGVITRKATVTPGVWFVELLNTSPTRDQIVTPVPRASAPAAVLPSSSFPTFSDQDLVAELRRRGWTVVAERTVTITEEL